jgi:hypothetical protein
MGVSTSGTAGTLPPPPTTSEPPDTEGETQPAAPTNARAQLIEWVRTAIPVIAGGIGFLGFVSALGAAIVWTRFNAAGLPADQAVSKFSRSDLVGIGAIQLVLFLALGLLAVLFVYLLQSLERPVPAGIEDIRSQLAVARADATAIDADLAAAKAVVDAGSATEWEKERLDKLTKLRRRAVDGVDELEAEVIGIEEAERGPAPRKANQAGVICLIAIEVAIIAVKAHASTASKVVLVVAAFATAIAVIYLGTREHAGKTLLVEPRKRTDSFKQKKIVKVDVVSALTQYLFLVAPLVLLVFLIDNWVLIPIGAALVLGLGNLAIGRLHPKHFFWFGCSVFVSVVLFGATLIFTRTERDPKLQPAAIVLNDGRAIPGLWVTETDDRVYLARVATKDGSDKPVPEGGSLFWFPSADVKEYAVGKLQSVPSANEQSESLLKELQADQKAAAIDEAAPNVVGPGGSDGDAPDDD